MPVEFEELQLPFDEVAVAAVEVAEDVVRSAAAVEAVPEPVRGAADPVPDIPVCRINRDPRGTFPCCPMCGGELRPEHAHYRCACGWRDSCCD